MSDNFYGGYIKTLWGAICDYIYTDEENRIEKYEANVPDINVGEMEVHE